MILTLKELADHLRVHQRTILRMLNSGQIQGTKIGGQWRFKSGQIDQLFFPGKVQTADHVPLADFTRSHLGITISRTMAPERMILSLKSTDVAGVVDELVSPAMLNTLVLDVQDLRRKVLDREKLLSTGVGNGIAVPHPRDSIPTLRRPAIIVFGRSKKGIDFSAADGEKVHLVFLLCCQTIELHLHLMGQLAHFLGDTDRVSACLACKTPEDILKQMLMFERARFLDNGGTIEGSPP